MLRWPRPCRRLKNGTMVARIFLKHWAPSYGTLSKLPTYNCFQLISKFILAMYSTFGVKNISGSANTSRSGTFELHPHLSTAPLCVQTSYWLGQVAVTVNVDLEHTVSQFHQIVGFQPGAYARSTWIGHCLTKTGQPSNRRWHGVTYVRETGTFHARYRTLIRCGKNLEQVKDDTRKTTANGSFCPHLSSGRLRLLGSAAFFYSAA